MLVDRFILASLMPFLGFVLFYLMGLNLINRSVTEERDQAALKRISFTDHLGVLVIVFDVGFKPLPGKDFEELLVPFSVFIDLWYIEGFAEC